MDDRSTLKTRLAAAIAARRGAMLATLKAVVEARSFSGHEEAAQAVMRRELEAAGFAIESIPVFPTAMTGNPLYSPVVKELHGCHNLLARMTAAGSQGRSLMVSGHVDVVPTGPEALWQTPPFATRTEDGWFYGRGAGDMKGGLVAALTGIRALADLGLQPAGPLWFNTVVEEECTGNGALATVEHLKQHGIRIDAMLDPEPFGESIMSGQVGTVWAQYILTGRPAHAMEAQKGLNPIEAAMHVWRRLKEVEARWNPPHALHPLFGGHPHPLNFNLGKIAGGEWASSVPTTCRVDFRFGIYPGRDPAEAKREVEAAIRAAVAELPEPPRCEVGYEGFHAPGCVVDLDAAPMRLLAACHTEVNGSPPPSYAATGTTDVRLFQLGAGIASTCYGPRAQRIHALDECVEIASMERVALVYALFIAGWCGVEAAAP
ncbi:MAG: ArgE/DapE family deacylase [Burkholderiales bacterium]|nr:ArgE/DapE family deacylase [Burkholderiales bacterium]